MQAAEKEGIKAESSFLFYKLNAGKQSVRIKTYQCTPRGITNASHSPLVKGI